jgi:hypothetical protein
MTMIVTEKIPPYGRNDCHKKIKKMEAEAG